MKKGWAWLCGTNPQGIGTLLVGIAAIWALSQGAALLKEILQIQEQAKQIGEAVIELKNQSKQISSAIDMMASQLKELKATEAVDSSPVLKAPNSTKEQIKEAIKHIPIKPHGTKATIFLPTDRIDGTVDLLFKAKTSGERKVILENSLEYRGSSILVNENGEGILTEDGNRLKVDGKPPGKK